ncbi:hypothetical protein PCC9214_05221 [Planktothrix tepida]|uniref:Uncharacterized protein n=1 Tax=Planktothrix tepida PCC 9214 TaxID=671072 RepID=A0A1J1LIA6_9CYAN|nr:hypothetical protein [Planktothrix tepida]CAD5983976.1 hypothetical protein PCC9214_05221 [Planktothrix tepida]CUR32231.1 conserved hypothetical protein [Planktothrix tepida PCC 9214]
MNDIAKQAHNGRVAAIIQVINEQMSDLGVRTRAVFTHDVLQLLCEAQNPELLEKTTIVTKIRGILESISPRNIRRVRINSRILKEQQLLWLETITQDPEEQLLWSEDIVLKKPILFKRWFNPIPSQSSTPNQPIVNNLSSTPQPEKRQFSLSVILGIGVSLLLGLIGFWLYSELQFQLFNALQYHRKYNVEVSPSPQQPLSSAEQFTQGVKLAIEAAAEGQVADTRQEWLEIAQKWQQAADLMAEVSPDFERYATAQNRASLYRRNQEQAQHKADELNNE